MDLCNPSINNELSINELYSNCATDIFYISAIKFPNNSFQFIIPHNCEVITECFLIFSIVRPKCDIFIEIIINSIIFDKFFVDQSEIYANLRNKNQLPPNIIPIKTFFNKYKQNYLPIICNMDIKIVVHFTNNNLIINDMKLLVYGTLIDYPNNKIFKLPSTKKIELHGNQIYCIKNEWIDFREKYNVLYTQAIKHKIFGITCILKHIMSFIKVTKPELIINKTIKIDLTCGGLLKELFWFAKCNNKIVNIIKNTRIFFNNHIRVEGDTTLFNKITQYNNYKNMIDNINIYPFCLHPTDFEYSGMVNTYKIDKIIVEMDLEYSGIKKYDIWICCTNINEIIYNVNGTCQLMYINK
jgi:hypothetical protein